MLKKIPKLYIMTPNGLVVTEDGRNDVIEK